MGTVREIAKVRARRDRPTIALLAHDAKKEEMLAFGRAHREMLSRLRLVATEMTGALLEKDLGFDVERVASGLLGGDLQVGARVVGGEIDAVLFFRDALSHPHDPDIRTMLKACDIHQVPLATNCATAEIVVRHLARRGVPTLASHHPSVFSGRRFPWDPIITRIPEPEKYGP